jgi:hypothetical protein
MNRGSGAKKRFSISLFPVVEFDMRLNSIFYRTLNLLLRFQLVFCTFPAFPAPVLYGYVIDSVCIVKQQMTCGRKGACLLYNHDTFRWKLHIMAAFSKAGATAFYMLALFCSRRRSSTVAAAGNGEVGQTDNKELKSLKPGDKNIEESTAKQNERATDSPTHSSYEIRL